MCQCDRERILTATEAAVLTRLPLKAVHNAIDKKAVATVAGRQPGQASRLLDLRGLMSLTLERRMADRFAPELRRTVFDAVAGNARNRVSLEGGFLTIDLREPRRELAASLRKLRRARALVISNPDILGGDPVFRGTRVPVHLIATLLEQGSTERELLEGYPRLTTEMVALAPSTRPRTRSGVAPAASPGMTKHRSGSRGASSRQSRRNEVPDRRVPNDRSGFHRSPGGT